MHGTGRYWEGRWWIGVHEVSCDWHEKTLGAGTEVLEYLMRE